MTMEPDDDQTEDIERAFRAYLAQLHAPETPDEDAQRALRLLQVRLAAFGLAEDQLADLARLAEELAQDLAQDDALL
jgi:hypothetical protein